MTIEIKQSTAWDFSFFARDGNGDPVTGLLDAGFTKRIKKHAGSWAALTITITEEENGWYKAQLSTSHTDTLGSLLVTFKHASCKQVNCEWIVKVRLLQDLAYPNTSGRGIDVDAGGGVEVGTFQTDAISAAAVSAAAAEKIADAKLGRNVAGGSNGGRTVSQVYQAQRNKVVFSGGTLTVYGTDDTTVLFTATYTTDGNGNVTLIDPA